MIMHLCEFKRSLVIYKILMYFKIEKIIIGSYIQYNNKIVFIKKREIFKINVIN